jgi:hypothetical protein
MVTVRLSNSRGQEASPRTGSGTTTADNREWDDDGDITFRIPEHVAWEINELAEEEGYSWACFAPALPLLPRDRLR